MSVYNNQTNLNPTTSFFSPAGSGGGTSNFPSGITVGSNITASNSGSNYSFATFYSSNIALTNISSINGAVYPPTVDGSGSTVLCQTLFEQQASGTNGGDGTPFVGTYANRTLNVGHPALSNLSGSIFGSTVIPNMRLDVSNNVFALPAGTYIVYASAPACAVSRTKIKLYNVTDSSDVAIGQTTYLVGNVYDTDSATLQTTFTISEAKTFALQQQIESLPIDGIPAGVSLGLAASFGDSEIYATVTVTKIA